MRLDASPAIGTQAKGAMMPLHALCLECGEGYTARVGHSEFCSPACRRTFNNRRAMRGAELYDLFMAHRFDRKRAQAMGLLGLINRIASNFRREDNERRNGRRSWREPGDVLAARPYLRAQSFDVGRKKR